MISLLMLSYTQIAAVAASLYFFVFLHCTLYFPSHWIKMNWTENCAWLHACQTISRVYFTFKKKKIFSYLILFWFLCVLLEIIVIFMSRWCKKSNIRWMCLYDSFMKFVFFFFDEISTFWSNSSTAVHGQKKDFK